MNFFERQARARRVSARLLVLFGLAVAGIVAAVDAAVWLALDDGTGVPPVGTLAFASLATLAVIGLGSLYRIASLRSGGDAVATQLGGMPVPEDTRDPSLRRLRNVVEEIAIASAVPVPALYVLEHEPGINAFAAGYAPSDAAVAVTRGALDRLNRDELQGVIAHEFSHILNGDMRLNIRLMGLLFGILMLGLIGRKVLYLGGGGRRGRGSAPVLAAALAAIVIGYVGVFFARMIKAGISRTRESLADAAAVQFTRQTAGLAGALKKIAGLPEGARLVADRGDAEEVSHMLFGDGVGFSGLFATHPPILERIRALEPDFDAARLEALSRQWMQHMPQALEEDARLGFAARDAGRLPDGDQSYAVDARAVADHVALPGADDYRHADALAAAMPASLHALAVRRDTAMALVLALLLDRDRALADRQDMEIAARLGSAVANAARELRAGEVGGLHPQLRLPLASLAFPVLRLRPKPEIEAFLDTIHAVVHVDGHVSLFEYCLGRLLDVQLRESLDPSGHARFGRRKPGEVRSEIATLLCVVAQAGHEDPADAQRAYLAAMRHVLPGDHLPYLPREGPRSLDPAWAPLDRLDPLAKQALVEAVTVAIGHDGRMSVAEAELLRTVCGVLHCPLPPLLAAA